MKRLLILVFVLMLNATCALAWHDVYYIDGGNSDRVHLRQSPSQSAKSLGLYFTGTDVMVVDWYDEWAHVVIGDVSGYMMSKYLTETKRACLGPLKMVNNPSSTWVNLRTSPSMNASIALCPDNGTSVRVLGETADGWSYVECQGIKGYMRTELLSATAEKIISQKTTVLSDMGWNSYIHRYVAPNGQAIYFTAELLEPRFLLEDVNFDGRDDLVIMTMTSAKSTAFQFFVYDVTQNAYVYVHHSDYEGGLINYTAYPQYGVIETHATNGNAGLLHVWNLYRWEGTNLKLIRSAVSDEWMEDSFEGSTYTQVIHGDMLHVVVRDHRDWYEESILWEVILPKAEAEYRDILTEEMAALWQGIK